MTPELIDDPVFGRLKWGSEIEWYEGRFEILPGCLVKVTFVRDRDVEFPEVFAAAHKQLQPLRSKLPSIYAQVREEFLEHHNRDFRGTLREGAITAAEFDELVHLKEVSFQFGSMIDLWYFDDALQLFGDHVILVQLDENLNVTSTGLEG